MTTSANVIEYNVYRGDGATQPQKRVGYFRKNVLCRLPDYSDLLKYQPLNEHWVESYTLDEDEEYTSDTTQPVRLDVFLRRLTPSNDAIAQWFERNDCKHSNKILPTGSNVWRCADCPQEFWGVGSEAESIPLKWIRDYISALLRASAGMDKDMQTTAKLRAEHLTDLLDAYRETTCLNTERHKGRSIKPESEHEL
jgi:hypothetical protein